MKKIGELVATKITIESEFPHPIQWDKYNIWCQPGRWEIFVDNEDETRQVVLKAKFQEPLSTDEGSSFFKGGKL